MSTIIQMVSAPNAKILPQTDAMLIQRATPQRFADQFSICSFCHRKL